MARQTPTTSVPQDVIDALTASSKIQAKLKYSPEIAALGLLLSQAFGSYRSSKAQALAGANIMANAARQQRSQLGPEFRAINESGQQAGAPPLGPAGKLAAAQQGGTYKSAYTMFSKDALDAIAGGQYQVGQAQKARDQQIQQINQQLLNLHGQAGDFAAAQYAAGLTDYEKQVQAQNLAQMKIDASAQQGHLDRLARARQGTLDRKSRAELQAARLAAGGGSGKGGGKVAPGGWLKGADQSDAQTAIVDTIQQIKRYSRDWRMNRADVAKKLREGINAGYIYPNDPRYPNDTVDQATGQLYMPNGKPRTIPRKVASGATVEELVKATKVAVPKIDPVKAVYVFAALDRLRYGGYRPSTIKMLHEAGIKVGPYSMPPDTQPTVGYGMT